VTDCPTDWYWVPAEPGEKVDWHPACYDAERGLIWVAECNGRGRRPSEVSLAHPAVLPPAKPKLERSSSL
jgi:hypothetical protein